MTEKGILNWEGWMTTSELAKKFNVSNRWIQKKIAIGKHLKVIEEALLVRFAKKVQRYLPIFRRINL